VSTPGSFGALPSLQTHAHTHTRCLPNTHTHLATFELNGIRGLINVITPHTRPLCLSHTHTHLARLELNDSRGFFVAVLITVGRGEFDD